jgi:CDP-diacylglycerol---serine O-phosphatidyltransferase
MSKIPNFITLCNAVCGIIAILLGNPILGAFLVLLSMVLDTVDGLAARMLNVKSELGKQLDSLSDLISFGVAPAFLFYTLFTDTESLLACIFYILSGLFRLAKFNTIEYSTDFNGLPIPAAAGIVSGYVLLYAYDAPASPDILPLITIIGPAICMNIHMKFFSLKGEGIFTNWKLWFVILATAITFYIDWHYALLMCFTSYLFVSFISGLWRNVRSA